jgi:hypothetical protein
MSSRRVGELTLLLKKRKVMFGRNNIQIDLAQIRPSSKMSLKMSCLAACGNNVEEAQKLYDFIASDINLPDTDVMPPSGFDKVKSSAESIFAWIGEHKEDILQGWNYIQAMRGGTPINVASSSVPTGVPPLP